jgi:predicted RecA/RadA family phage recombinase
MKNFVQEGDALTVVAPYAVSSGDGVQVGAIFGVAFGNAALGGAVELSREGVFVLTAAAADTATQGAHAYWDNTAREVTTVATNNALIGAFAASKAAATTTATVLVDGAVR